MFIMKFPKKLVTNEVFNYIADSHVKSLVRYIIDGRYRKSVLLSKWLKKQIEEPDEAVVEFANSIPTYNSYDSTVKTVLKKVKEIQYTGDHKLWGTLEKWQTALETVTSMKGDCEDGAILLYVICRIKGIPENRFEICAGNVMLGKKKSGHCWLAYRPESYPINYVFLDWCYWYESKNIQTRSMYSIIGNKIFTPRGIKERYKDIWFTFTENESHLSLKSKWSRAKNG